MSAKVRVKFEMVPALSSITIENNYVNVLSCCPREGENVLLTVSYRYQTYNDTFRVEKVLHDIKEDLVVCFLNLK